MNLRRFVLTATLLTFAFHLAAHAQPGAGAGKTTVVKAARMFDGKSERLVSPGVVVVKDGVIVAVGAAAQIPPDATVIDLGDATLLPGFMDAHTHLTGEIFGDWRQQVIDGLQKPIPEIALDAIEYPRKTLLAGFTTVRDLGAGDYVDVALRNAIRNGKIPGPRMLVAVSGIGATGGHCDSNGWRYNVFNREPGAADGVINGPEQARQAVRLAHKYGADVIKTCATGGVLSQRAAVDTPQLTQAELDALVDEAHALRLKTAAHAHGAEGAKRAIRAGVDSIEHGSFLDDEALDLMRARGTVFIPTLMAAQGLRERLQAGGSNMPPEIAAKARAAIAGISNAVKRAVAKGVRIGFGTDAAVYPHGRNAEEFQQLVSLGVKPIDALKAATMIDAELFGVADRLGSLEAGKIADVVAVPGDPLADIRVTEKLFFVMKEGVVFRNDRAK